MQADMSLASRSYGYGKCLIGRRLDRMHCLVIESAACSHLTSLREWEKTLGAGTLSSGPLATISPLAITLWFIDTFYWTIVAELKLATTFRSPITRMSTPTR